MSQLALLDQYKYINLFEQGDLNGWRGKMSNQSIRHAALLLFVQLYETNI